MATQDLLCGYASENVAGAYSALTATTEDADYPATNLHDQNPAKPMKLTGSSGNIVWQFASPARIDWVTFGPHNLAGGTATIQANTTNSWGSPALSAAITIPANFRDGMSRHPWIDLTTKAGYSTGGYAYWRLVVASTGANVAIGEVWFAAHKRTVTNLRFGSTRRRARPAVEHRTDYGVSTIYDLGVLQRVIEGQWLNTDAKAQELLDLWHESNGRADMFPIVTDQTGTEAMFVRFGVEMAEEQLEPGVTALRPVFEEVGRGLYL